MDYPKPVDFAKRLMLCCLSHVACDLAPFCCELRDCFGVENLENLGGKPSPTWVGFQWFYKGFPSKNRIILVDSIRKGWDPSHPLVATEYKPQAFSIALCNGHSTVLVPHSETPWISGNMWKHASGERLLLGKFLVFTNKSLCFTCSMLGDLFRKVDLNHSKSLDCTTSVTAMYIVKYHFHSPPHQYGVHGDMQRNESP